MNAALQLIVLIGLVTRLTLLVVADRITLAPRRWVQTHTAPGGYVEYLTWCPACVSVHAAWVTVGAWWLWPGFTLDVAIGATAALIAAVLVQLIAHPTPPQPEPTDD